MRELPRTAFTIGTLAGPISFALLCGLMANVQVIAASVPIDHANETATTLARPLLGPILCAILGAGVLVIGFRRGWLKTEPGVVPAPDRGLILIGLFLLQLLAPALLLPFFSGSLDVGSLQGRAIAQWSSYAIQLPLALLAVRALPLSDARPGRSVGLGVLGLLCAVPLLVAGAEFATRVQSAFTGTVPSSIAHDTLRRLLDARTDPWAIVVIASVVIGAPVLEEIAYRGSLCGAIRSMGIRGWPAVALTSGFFALMHVQMIPADALAGALVTLMILALVLGLLREYSRGLVAPIVAHSLFNAANIAIAWASVQ